MLRAGDRVLLVLGCQRVHDDRRHWHALEYDPSAVFGAWEGFDLKSQEVFGGPADPVRAPAVRRMNALVRERGALPYRPEQAAEFARLTDIDGSAAAMLLLGLPGMDRYGRDGLPDKAVLEGCGLTTSGAELAHVLLSPLSLADRRRLLADLVPAGPDGVERLWDEGGDLTAATTRWLARFGRRPVVPTELLARAKREGLGPNQVVRVLSPEHQRELTGRTRQRMDGRRLSAVDSGAMPSGNDLASYTHALRWLAYRLPYGDPLRAVLPAPCGRCASGWPIRSCCWTWASDWTSEGKPTSAGVRAAYGLPETGGRDADGLVAAGPALVLTPTRYGPRRCGCGPRPYCPTRSRTAGPTIRRWSLLAGWYRAAGRWGPAGRAGDEFAARWPPTARRAPRSTGGRRAGAGRRGGGAVRAVRGTLPRSI